MMMMTLMEDEVAEGSYCVFCTLHGVGGAERGSFERYVDHLRGGLRLIEMRPLALPSTRYARRLFMEQQMTRPPPSHGRNIRIG